MKHIIIYTDGACSKNPGPGGWGAILTYGSHTKEICGFVPETTNNRMEIFSAVQALRCLKEPCDVDLYSDSAYLVNAFEKNWIRNWQKNGWRTVSKQPVENQDLWQQLLVSMASHRVTWHKVKGHADNPYNNRCDELARGEVEGYLKTARQNLKLNDLL